MAAQSLRKRKEIKSEYLISEKTMGVFWNEDLEYTSKILEPNRIVYCNKSPIQIITESCAANGTPLSDRRGQMERILHSNTKLPVAINPEAYIYMFPTRSPRSIYCNWIAFYHVLAYDHKKEHEGSTIIFQDRTKVRLTTPGLSLEKQMHRTAMGIAAHIRDTLQNKDFKTQPMYSREQMEELVYVQD
ncbi:competence protein ComK [Pontibacillus salicampi]|uniref:Competence protein ComK n=1 Tax=Pontibacillus salicampi TaxID=1449801 RepID=A0ABV6LS81_9BACI